MPERCWSCWRPSLQLLLCLKAPGRNRLRQLPYRQPLACQQQTALQIFEIPRCFLAHRRPLAALYAQPIACREISRSQRIEEEVGAILPRSLAAVLRCKI